MIRLHDSLSVKLLSVYLLPVAVVLIALAPAWGQPTARQILERAAKHYDAINDYKADAKLTVESPTLHVPEMRVTIYYKKPDKLQVKSEDGFAMLPRNGVIIGNPLRQLISGSEIALGQPETVLGCACHVIKGAYQREGRAVQTTVWIDKKSYVVRQIAANPEWGPSVTVKLWYSQVADKYWLPVTTAAKISIPPLPGAHPQTGGKPAPPTIVTIRFKDYRINTGLSDNLFEKQEGNG